MRIGSILRREQRELDAAEKRITRTVLGGSQTPPDEREEPPPRHPVLGLRVVPNGPDHLFDHFRMAGVVCRFLVIGAAPTCHIALKDPAVSESHCLIERYHGRVYVHDVGSKNGLYVNGRRTRIRELREGALLTVGKTTFIALSDRSPAPLHISAATLNDYLMKAAEIYGSVRAAAKGIGVPYSTLRRWLAELRQSENA